MSHWNQTRRYAAINGAHGIISHMITYGIPRLDLKTSLSEDSFAGSRKRWAKISFVGLRWPFEGIAAEHHGEDI